MAEERLSLTEIAERAKKRGARISIGYINNILRGHSTNPSVEILKALAIGLGRPEGEVFRAAGVKTGETLAGIEVSRFAEMARIYSTLSATDKRSLEAFIAGLEHALKTAATRSFKNQRIL